MKTVIVELDSALLQVVPPFPSHNHGEDEGGLERPRGPRAIQRLASPATRSARGALMLQPHTAECGYGEC